jgi:hypothetical protein
MPAEVYDPAFFAPAIDFSAGEGLEPEATTRRRGVITWMPRSALRRSAGIALGVLVLLPLQSADSQLVIRRSAVARAANGARADLSVVSSQLEELDKLRELPTDWDTYGAPTPSAAAIETAKEFLIGLVNAGEALGTTVGAPSVQASGAGTVGFAWSDRQKDWSLEIEAHPDRSLTFVRSQGDEVEVGTVDSPSQVLEKLKA